MCFVEHQETKMHLKDTEYGSLLQPFIKRWRLRAILRHVLHSITYILMTLQMVSYSIFRVFSWSKPPINFNSTCMYATCMNQFWIQISKLYTNFKLIQFWWENVSTISITIFLSFHKVIWKWYNSIWLISQ